MSLRIRESLQGEKKELGEMERQVTRDKLKRRYQSEGIRFRKRERVQQEEIKK